MYLHDHARIDRTGVEPVVYFYHRALDDVRCGSLHRCIDRAAFGILASRRVARINLGKVKPPAENGFHIPLFARQFTRVVHERLDARIAVEIQVDIFLGLVSRNAKLPGEAES